MIKMMLYGQSPPWHRSVGRIQSLLAATVAQPDGRIAAGLSSMSHRSVRWREEHSDGSEVLGARQPFQSPNGMTVGKNISCNRAPLLICIYCNFHFHYFSWISENTSDQSSLNPYLVEYKTCPVLWLEMSQILGDKLIRCDASVVELCRRPILKVYQLVSITTPCHRLTGDR